MSTPVPLDDALARLVIIEDYDNGAGPQPCVHTFRGTSGFILGAHWTLVELTAAMKQYGVYEATRPRLGHTLMLTDNNGPVMIAAALAPAEHPLEELL